MQNKTMLSRLRERADGESGFTLIELLIVITILGILAAIVVFAVGTTSGSATTAACKADKSTVETAVEAYAAQHDGNFPATLGALVPTWLRDAIPADVNSGSYSATDGSFTMTGC